MTELEKSKLEAEIAHIKAQAEQAAAETAKANAERESSQKTWGYWAVEAVKVVGAITIGIGGFMAAFTGYQLAEAKKERMEAAVDKAELSLTKIQAKADELKHALAAAQAQLDTTGKQLRELQTQLVAAKTQPAADRVALDAAIAQTSEIRAGVNSAKTGLRSAQAPPNTAAPPKGIETRVRDLLVEQLGVRPDQVKPNASLVQDLGADELDIVEVVMALEEEFSVEIPDQDAASLKTVGDIVTYVRKHAAPAKGASSASKLPATTPSPSPTP